jgi:uroporphyrinogen decarboxylase
MATIERKPVDYPASWIGLPDAAALPALFAHFKVSNQDELKIKLNDDLYDVVMPYHSPTSDKIEMAFNFAKNKLDERTLTAPGFFENCSDPDDVNKFDWPDPAKYIDPELCRKVVDAVPKQDYAITGVVWSSRFQDACSAFGMEAALIKLYAEPEMFKAVIDRITEFYLRANEIFFEATKGKLHAVLFGDDYASQYGLLVSPEILREYVLDGTRQLVEQAKSYGLKVSFHSCGSAHDVIPDLIAMGVDVVEPIQALATNMEPQRLKNEFGDKMSFSGGVDAQYLLVKGTPEQVREKVRELKGIFPTGLVVSSSHETILPDMPPENIEALYDEVRRK